jgi:hypothetical protein
MIHHKFRTAVPILALVGQALLGSCTQDEEAPEAVSSIRGIDFDAGEDAPGSLKASPATGSQLTDFIVSAFWSDGDGDWATGTSRLFDAQSVYKIEGGDWDYRPKKIWPSTGSVAFYAYAPAGSPNTDGLSGKGSSGEPVPVITYTVPDSPADQEDFMLAVKSYDTGDLSGAVSLRFRHVLSYITVSVQNNHEENIRVSKLELRNIHKAGSLKLKEDDGADVSNGIPVSVPIGDTDQGFRYDDSGQEQVILWTSTDDAADNAIAFATGGDITVHEGATVSLTGNTNGLFVLPQSIAGNGDDVLDDGEAYIHVEYTTYGAPSVTLTENIRLDLAAFEAGRRYAVMLELKAPFDEDHDPAATNVWAASNIYFKPDQPNGFVGSLTFAESKADGTTIGRKEGYQGVFFKWGSLIGVSAGGMAFLSSDSYLFIPDLATGKYYKVTVGGVGSSSIQAVIDFRNSSAMSGWNGSGGSATWNVIPYATVSDIPDNLTDSPYNSLLTDYSSSLRTSYKGDICRYLSFTRSTNGSGLSGKKNWKTPARYMFGELSSYSGNWDDYASFSDGIAADGTNRTSDGIKTYIYAHAGMNETVIFPAAGGYMDESPLVGMLASVGFGGIYWSSSSSGGSSVYSLTFASSSMFPDGNSRTCGNSVRCVKE